MSDISMKDVTGTPRSEREVQEALDYVTKQMIKDPLCRSFEGEPRLLHYVVIRDALRELLAMRAVIAAARARRQAPPPAPIYDREAPTHPGKTNAIPPPPSTPIHRSDEYIEAEGAVSMTGVPKGMEKPKP